MEAIICGACGENFINSEADLIRFGKVRLDTQEDGFNHFTRQDCQPGDPEHVFHRCLTRAGSINDLLSIEAQNALNRDLAEMAKLRRNATAMAIDWPMA